MNYAGCKRKFNVDAYVQKVRHMMKQVKAKQAAGQSVAASAAQHLPSSSQVPCFFPTGPLASSCLPFAASCLLPLPISCLSRSCMVLMFPYLFP
jgi:hypothetical protein